MLPKILTRLIVNQHCSGGGGGREWDDLFTTLEIDVSVPRLLAGIVDKSRK